MGQPPEKKVRVNEVRFKAVMTAEVGKSWRRERSGNRNAPFRYLRLSHVIHPREDEGGE